LDLTTFNGSFFYAVYDSFSLGPGDHGYRLFLGRYAEGNLPADDFRWHNEEVFGARDKKYSWKNGVVELGEHSG